MSHCYYDTKILHKTMISFCHTYIRGFRFPTGGNGMQLHLRLQLHDFDYGCSFSFSCHDGVVSHSMTNAPEDSFPFICLMHDIMCATESIIDVRASHTIVKRRIKNAYEK